MKKLIGRPGSASGLALRLVQLSCAAASISVMVSAKGFATFTAFCYMIASMGLQMTWSLGLACLDAYALKSTTDIQNPFLVSLFVVGDWVTATLSLAAASSSAGIMILYARDMDFCSSPSDLPCSRFQISVALAFISWGVTAISTHVMFWILLTSI